METQIEDTEIIEDIEPITTTQKIKVDGAWVYGIPAIDEWYKQEVATGVWQEQRNVAPSPEPDLPDVFTTANESVKINGNAPEAFSPVYLGKNGDSITMSFDIVDSQGVLQAQLDGTVLGYPPVLSLPVLKVAGGGSGSTVVGEIYFSTTLVDGVISVTGSFPESGAWKMYAERINASLAEIGADWSLDKQDVTFRITT